VHPRFQPARTLLAHVALAVMLLRALLPTGWMPSTGPQGSVELVVCSVSGPVLSPADLAAPSKPSKSGDSHSSDQECPFAAAPHFAAAASLVPLAQPVPAVVRFPAPPAGETIAIGAPYAPQAPRAPPIA
jgi:hypothetical protein